MIVHLPDGSTVRTVRTHLRTIGVRGLTARVLVNLAYLVHGQHAAMAMVTRERRGGRR